MKKLLLFLLSVFAGISYIEANAPPPYIETQLHNLNLQIQELKLQRAELVKQLETTSDTELQKNQYRAQIQQLNSQIQFLEQQKERLIQDNK